MRYMVSVFILASSLGYLGSAGASPISLSDYSDPADFPAAYKVPVAAFPSEADVAAKVPEHIQGPYNDVFRESDISEFKKNEDLYTLYEGRLLYLPVSFARAREVFAPLFREPYPAPIESVQDVVEKTLAPNHWLQTMNMLTFQKKSGVTIATRCQAAIHLLDERAGVAVYQTAVKDCRDRENASKMWFPDGRITNHLFAVREDVTGVLIRNVLVAKRHSVGPVPIPLSKYVESNRETADKAMATIIDRLK